jgi:hypothetical protein
MKFLAVAVFFFLSVLGMDSKSNEIKKLKGIYNNFPINENYDEEEEHAERPKKILPKYDHRETIQNIEKKAKIEARKEKIMNAPHKVGFHHDDNEYYNDGKLTPRETDESLYILSDILGIPAGLKLEQIINTICHHGYKTLEQLQYYVNDDEELRLFGMKTLHIKRWNNYITSGCFYDIPLIPKEKHSFENALSCIIGVPRGSKLDEIMNAFAENGYNATEDLWDVEKEELRSFGLKNLHLLRWRIYFTNERIYLVTHRWQVKLDGVFSDYPLELSMRLEEAFENGTGPIKRQIDNGFTYSIDPVARTQIHVDSNILVGHAREIRKVQVKIESKLSIKDAVINIIEECPALLLKRIMKEFSQNGYKSLNDLWYAEKDELRSFGLHESHIKSWEDYFNYMRIYLIQSHWQYELDGGGRKFYKEEVSRHLEEVLENGTGPILCTSSKGNGNIYEIDPVACTQTNLESGKTRTISRVYQRMHWNNDIQLFYTVEEFSEEKDDMEIF